MIGVASRKAKRAASSLERPESRPPLMLAPDRDRPGISASAWAVPIPTASRKLRLRAITSSELDALPRADRGPTPERLGAEQHQPVDEEEDRGGLGRGEESSQRVLEQQAEQPRGNRPDDEQPAELCAGVVRGDVAVAKRATEAFQDPNPVLEEEEKEDDAPSRSGWQPGSSGSSRRSGGCPSRRCAGARRCARGSRSGRARRSLGAGRGRLPGSRRLGPCGGRDGARGAEILGDLRRKLT